MQPFGYTHATTVADAITAFTAAGEGARYISGGTTLYDLMKLNIEHPAHLIDIADIEGAAQIVDQGQWLDIGAAARMADVAQHPAIRRDYPLLSESLWKAASQQLRNMASVGGNLLQRTRCPYFRNGAGGVYPCNKREPGSGCAAIDGLDRGQALLGISAACSAVSPGDWPVALTALDARIILRGPEGERILPITEFYRLLGDRPDLEFALQPGELVTAIRIPKTSSGRQSTYHKVRDRESYAFALVSAAVALTLDGGRISEARIALGGVATRPWRSLEAENLLQGQTFTGELALTAGHAAMTGARPGRDNRFKIELAARTVADALLIAAERNL